MVARSASPGRAFALGRNKPAGISVKRPEDHLASLPDPLPRPAILPSRPVAGLFHAVRHHQQQHWFHPECDRERPYGLKSW
jgi:hypothetical protein